MRVRLVLCDQPGAWFGAVCVFAVQDVVHIGVLAHADGSVQLN